MKTTRTRILAVAVALAVMLAAHACASSPDITRGPYVQDPAADGITVMWRTAASAPSEVVYWTDGSEPQMAAGDAGVFHEVRLSGLSEDTLYHYRVNSGTDKPLKYSFMTATTRPVPFRFVAFGDSRGDAGTVEEISGLVASLDPPARFALHTGDIVDDGLEEEDWDEQFFEPQHPMMANLPVYFAMGNHENGSELYFDYLAQPGNERWYAFEYGDAVFFCLDTTSPYGKGSPQYDWFASALDKYTDKRWKFAFFHNPPYSSSYHGPDMEVRKQLVPVFEEHGIDMVFNGHDHNYERTVNNGITYVVTGGYGAPRRPRMNGAEESGTFSLKHHFCTIDVTEGALNVTVTDDDGKLIESFELTKPAS